LDSIHNYSLWDTTLIHLRTTYYTYDENANIDTSTYLTFPVNVDDEIRKTRFKNFWNLITSDDDILEEQLQFKLSNPESRTLNIEVGNLEANENYKLAIYDVNGRVVKYRNVEHQTRLGQTYKLEVGFYFVSIWNKDSRYTEKVVLAY